MGFYGCNTINNITEANNLVSFRISNDNSSIPQKLTIEIPCGAYEIEEINAVIQKHIMFRLFHDKKPNDVVADDIFYLHANNNTFKCEMRSKYEIDLTHPNSIAEMMGFAHGIFPPNQIHESSLPINITTVRLIRLDCNIISGSYINGEESHILFSFDIDVEPGYNLTKEPHSIIYMPVSPEGRQLIHNITVRILDEKNNLIDFGSEEEIFIILELKKIE
ncbi:hypothetical protein GO639_09805 [Staphylococcus aureus]|nr:hypothetical protein [Staphylococcus aureus]